MKRKIVLLFLLLPLFFEAMEKQIVQKNHELISTSLSDLKITKALSFADLPKDIKVYIATSLTRVQTPKQFRERKRLAMAAQNIRALGATCKSWREAVNDPKVMEKLIQLLTVHYINDFSTLETDQLLEAAAAIGTPGAWEGYKKFLPEEPTDQDILEMTVQPFINNKLSLITFLLNAPNKDIVNRVTEFNGLTLLQTAVLSGRHKIVALLLAQPGIKLDMQDKKGRTLWAMAQQAMPDKTFGSLEKKKNAQKIIAMLEEKGLKK